MFFYEGVKCENVICGSIFWYESNLAFSKDAVVTEKVLQSVVNDWTENLTKIATDTNASIIVWVKFIAIFKDGCY